MTASGGVLINILLRLHEATKHLHDSLGNVKTGFARPELNSILLAYTGNSLKPIFSNTGSIYASNPSLTTARGIPDASQYFANAGK